MSKIPFAKKAISIPFKIKRSPTDLLKALSRTVNPDPVGPSYNLIDDTNLEGFTFNDVKRYSLSRASGIKAARLMIEKYPEGFMKDECEPHIPSFFPPKQFTEQELKYPSESLMYSLMSWGKFKQAFDTYQRCKDEKIEITEECKLMLLDLLSIHNSEDLKEKVPNLEEFYMKAPSKTGSYKTDVVVSSWKKNSEAEVLFNELSTKTAEAYCSLIKGMAKYNEIEGAKNLFNELKNKNLTPDLSTLNVMLKFLIQSDEPKQKKLEMIVDKLNEIKNYGLKPNLNTFNICLNIVKTFGLFENSIQLTLNLLKEMESVGVRPSLTTFDNVLGIFYPSVDIGSRTGVLEQVVAEVEKMDSSETGLEMRDINDPIFFRTAMEKCISGNNAANLDYAKRLCSLILRHGNIKFLNDVNLYNKFFELYLQIVIKFDTPENVIKEWRHLTPYIYQRSVRVFEKMIFFVGKNKCYDFIPELWSGFLEFKPKMISNFVSKSIKSLLNVMANYEEKDQNLIEKYASIAQKMLDVFPYLAPVEEKEDDEIQDTRQKFEYEWEGSTLSDYFQVISKVKNLELMWTEFDKYNKNQTKVVGELREDCMQLLFDAFNDANQTDRAFEVLKFAAASKFLIANKLISVLSNKSDIDFEKKAILKQLKQKYVL